MSKIVIALALAIASPTTADEAVQRFVDILILGALQPPHHCEMEVIKPPNQLSYWTVVFINRRPNAFFAIDTGFSGSLSIPRAYSEGLVANGTIDTRLDRRGSDVTSRLADGSLVTEPTILLREIILPGCRVFSNVVAAISDGGIPLIGEGVLSRFRSASIDHVKMRLILDP